MIKSLKLYKSSAVAAILLAVATLQFVQVRHIHSLAEAKIAAPPVVATILQPEVLQVTKPVIVAVPPAAITAKATTKSTAAKSPPPAAPAPGDIASASACPGQDQLAQTQTVLLCMTNYARHFHGLGNVATNAMLTTAAQAKANDIVTCDDFSHTACGHPSDYWVTTKGYTGNCSGENIAKGQKTPGEVFVSWMNSAGHRENILRPPYIDIGVAEQSSSSGIVWVMELGGC